MSKRTIFLSIDLEVSGPHLSNGIVSCGLCLGEWTKEKTNVLENFRVDFDTTNIIFDPDCKARFWDKNPHLLEAFAKNALPPKEALGKLTKWFNAVDMSYPNDEFNLILVTDRPSLDVAMLNNELHMFCGRRPVDYGPNGEYRSIFVPDDAIFLDTLPWPTINVKHDHFPENDALYNFQLACYAYNRKEQLKATTV